MTEFVDATIFGRDSEMAAIENALRDSSKAGIVIEGDMGTGKTTLAAEIHRRRGGHETWVRGDRILKEVPFGAFGLYVDLTEKPSDLLVRSVEAIRASDEPTPVIFIEDAHELDDSSLGALWQLANDGDIRVVITFRPPVDDSARPFSDLVADQVVDHVGLEPLSRPDFIRMIEHHLGGIVSQGVIDVVEFQSGRVPGKIVELLRYTSRKRRLIDSQGVWLLDGLDIDYDDRARDVTRIHLSRFSEQQREALELVVLAGEVEVGQMLAAGLGEAADTLAAAGELAIVQRGARAYAAIENHSTETIRYTVPMGRSREMFDFVDSFDDEPSERARMHRADWGLSCGARISLQDSIDAARIAVGLGEWHRALRILQEVPTDDMAAHELFDLGQLYSDVNRVPIGLDVFAQAVEKACCTSVVLDVFAVWIFRDFHRDSPPLDIGDFRMALSRLDASGPSHETSGLSVDRAREFIDLLYENRWETLEDGSESLSAWARDPEVPRQVRICLGINAVMKALELAHSADALALLDELEDCSDSVGTGYLLLGLLRIRALLQENRGEEASEVLVCRISNDLSYTAARSGPTDLMWTRLYLEDGDLMGAVRRSAAAVEALDYWNQDQFLAIALAEAEHLSVLSGNIAAADAFDLRYLTLPTSRAYIESRRAEVLRLSARAKATGDQEPVTALKELLGSAEDAGSHQIAAMIRIELFRHFGEHDSEAMERLGKVGSGRNCRLLGDLGPALRTRDKSALGEIADTVAARMPDLAERCRSLVNGGEPLPDAGTSGAEPLQRIGGVSLTGRERQISRLIIAGMTNAEIADELGVAVRTVEGHTYRMYRKLDITSRDQVAEAIGGAQPHL